MSFPRSVVIVGLGNPGREHSLNRHNIGFMVVDRIAVRVNFNFNRLQFKALVAAGAYAGCKVILMKPQTYMNLSGRAVSSLVRFYKLAPADLLVIYDDMDLPLGKMRIRPAGGSGGHQGMISIIGQLGTQMFPRLRIGIDRPPGRMDPADYVLQDFLESESLFLSETLERAVDSVLSWIQEGPDATMTRYNTRQKGVGE